MYKVIACAIFQPYIEMLSWPKEEYDFVYLEIQQHNYPIILAKNIQMEINSTKGYQKIIILYGLCGGALLSIQAKDIPLVLVRVHDCMAILLGSKQRYMEVTREHKSMSWSCYSLKKENYTNHNLEEWKKQYDEEMIAYLSSVLLIEPMFYISMNHPKEATYIETEQTIIKGDLQFLKEILEGTSKEVLLLNNKEVIQQSLDEKVITKRRRV